ncbi:MAG: hypothetical protein MZU97_11975 [Bacillus subtilis]|nr:hypothetical protein [Bacillus subtilis]
MGRSVLRPSGLASSEGEIRLAADRTGPLQFSTVISTRRFRARFASVSLGARDCSA